MCRKSRFFDRFLSAAIIARACARSNGEIGFFDFRDPPLKNFAARLEKGAAGE